MRPITALALALLAATPALAAPRESDADRLQKRLAGLVPGKPTGCITQLPSNQSETYDGAIVYKVGGTTYVNRLGGDCRFQAGFDTLITSTPGGQLCRGDIAQVVEAGIPVPKGTCIYGDFETYTKPKGAK